MNTSAELSVQPSLLTLVKEDLGLSGRKTEIPTHIQSSPGLGLLQIEIKHNQSGDCSPRRMLAGFGDAVLCEWEVTQVAQNQSWSDARDKSRQAHNQEKLLFSTILPPSLPQGKVKFG